MMPKRSLTLHGHRTSVSLEDEFWDAFKAIAVDKGVSVNELARRIDSNRDLSHGLASSIRVFVLNHHRNNNEDE